MKYLLVLIVVMIGFWVWRSNRAEEKSESRRAQPKQPKQPKAVVDMVGCDVCGLHCPREDVVKGRKGMYCSIQHRNQVEA